MFNSCETTDLNLTENPNALVPLQADVEFFLNDIQISFARTVNTFGSFGSETTRIEYMFGGGGNYQTAYSDVNFSGVWENSYQRIIKDIRTMNPLAEEVGL
ncbi:MAG: SusD/RagB family nutrient-binding outer membrane lipoprotein, partial [Flavobacteriaceae bacterium CG02_land_8_20_14_3_00_34_13]